MGWKEYFLNKQTIETLKESERKYLLKDIYFANAEDRVLGAFVCNIDNSKIKNIENGETMDIIRDPNKEYTYWDDTDRDIAVAKLFNTDEKVFIVTSFNELFSYTKGSKIPGEVFQKLRASIILDKVIYGLPIGKRFHLIEYSDKWRDVLASFEDLKPLMKECSKNIAKRKAEFDITKAELDKERMILKLKKEQQDEMYNF